MKCTQNIKNDIYWVGASDRRLALFENAFPVPNGISYNAYLIMDEKTVLMDCCDKSVADKFIENVEATLNGRELDYVVISHMEPDHCVSLAQIVRLFPNVKIVGNAKTFVMIKQFFNFDITDNCLTVKENDILDCGKHKLKFIMAPMVHWPEVMVAYDLADQILFSADAFGTFGAINGNLFADQIDLENKYLDEARRYYTNIVGKYGMQVMGLFKKLGDTPISVICPLHGPVIRENVEWFINKNVTWASYKPEEKGVVIAFASVYGNTENACELLATELSNAGVNNIQMYDVSVTHPSYVLSQCFKYSNIVFASTTYNNGLFPAMENLLHDLKAHSLQNKTVAIVENGSWASQSGKIMKEIISSFKDINMLEVTPCLKSSVKETQLADIKTLASEIVESLK